MKKIYIFSLGNPDLGGKVKYKYTRHNAARLLCGAFDFEEYNSNVAASAASSKVEATVGSKEIKINNFNFIHIIPDCFMNESGKFISDYIKYKNININQVAIAYDDIDIPFGEIKLAHNRNAGGHNGVESVIQKLGTKEFYRVRVGIGSKPVKEILLQDYVLSKLSTEEVKILESKEMKSRLETKLKELTLLMK